MTDLQEFENRVHEVIDESEHAGDRTYMRLAIVPEYQRENLEADPVCGMAVSGTDVVYRCEVGERSYYFCSEPCFARFVAEPAWFLAHPARPVGG